MRPNEATPLASEDERRFEEEGGRLEDEPEVRHFGDESVEAETGRHSGVTPRAPSSVRLRRRTSDRDLYQYRVKNVDGALEGLADRAPVGDAPIRAEVVASFAECYVSARSIDVQVTDRVVTLVGSVNDEPTWRLAGHLAESARGVKRVVNLLRVTRR